MGRQNDYGPKVCCGPAAYSVLLVIVGGLAALVAVIA